MSEYEKRKKGLVILQKLLAIVDEGWHLCSELEDGLELDTDGHVQKVDEALNDTLEHIWTAIGYVSGYDPKIITPNK